MRLEVGLVDDWGMVGKEGRKDGSKDRLSRYRSIYDVCVRAPNPTRAKERKRKIRTVEAVLVAELVPAGVVRVVAVAHAVEVVPLEQQDVPDHGGLVHGLARHGVVLVPVHPAQNDGRAVHQERPVLDLHRAARALVR